MHGFPGLIVKTVVIAVVLAVMGAALIFTNPIPNTTFRNVGFALIIYVAPAASIGFLVLSLVRAARRQSQAYRQARRARGGGLAVRGAARSTAVNAGRMAGGRTAGGRVRR